MKNPLGVFENDSKALLAFCNDLDDAYRQHEQQQQQHYQTSVSHISNSQSLSSALNSTPRVAAGMVAEDVEDVRVLADEQSLIFGSRLVEMKDKMFSLMLAHAQRDLAPQITAYKTLCNTSDLRIPHEWYPAARIMKRKVIYHGGPTNSGKVRFCLIS